MNFFKKALASFIAMILFCCSFSACLTVSAAEMGTYDNPENANDRYFSAAQCYLINTDLAAGDEDGYWYVFTADSAGVVCIDATAKDANGNDTNSYQVTVECSGRTYYAFEEIYARPITPFRVKKGDVVKIHFTATPDANGAFPKLKIYANIATVYGNDNAPINVKSKEGFIAYIQADRSVVYQDGTSGGLYGGKGIVVEGLNDVISVTEVTVNSVVYTDTDKDGKIELMLPGDPSAMIPLHPIVTIYNGSKTDAKYVVRLVDDASESSTPLVCDHNLVHFSKIEPCHRDGTAEYWYCSKCDTYYSNQEATAITDVEKLILPADRDAEYSAAVEASCSANGVLAHWHCPECNEYYLDESCSAAVEYSSLLTDKISHESEYSETLTESTFTEKGTAVYICTVCGEEEIKELPFLEHWIKGDINNDGKINAADGNILKRILVGYSVGIQEKDAADMNSDGLVNAIDSNAIKRVVTGA